MIARERGGYIGKEKPKVGDAFPESFGMIAPQEKFPRRFFSLVAEFFEANSHRLTAAEFEGAPIGAGARENLSREPGRARRIPARIREPGQIPGENFGENFARGFCGDSQNFRTEIVR